MTFSSLRAVVLVAIMVPVAACDRPVADVGPVPQGQVEVTRLALAPTNGALLGPVNPSGGCVTNSDCPLSTNPCSPNVCDSSTGTCGPRPAPDTTACNDGNACTTGDQCKAGTCTPISTITCTASDQCYNAGTCDPTNGKCSALAKPDGTTCNDNLVCTSGDTCRQGICTGTVTCPAADACHDVGVCNTVGACTSPAKMDGTACNDSNACTRTDACMTGACVGGSPVVCTASDQCHDAGLCNPQTAACSNPAKADGTTCNDGNACTRTDACTAGACTGSSPVVCVASDQCHSPGTCDAQTGMCSNPAKSPGAGCDDGKLCTSMDACTDTGMCVGKAVTCVGDACNARTCNGTDKCTVTPKTGSQCDDGNACTHTDACSDQGTCGGKAITCTTDQFATRTCNGTDTCTIVPKAGAACDDGDLCTKGDVRQADGACAGMRYTCAMNPCLVSNTCDGNNGCKAEARPDGTTCDADNSKCTPKDVCKAGLCMPDPKRVACVTKDCNTVVCNPDSGSCEYTATSGGACGVTGCYSMGTCSNGMCSGKAKDCSKLDGPCGVGICDATSGECMTSDKPNGTMCSAGGKCSAGAVCAFGVCELAAQTCPMATGPCKTPACDPESGRCIENNRTQDSPCDPNNSCLTDATCDGTGECVGVPAPNGEPCTAAGGVIGRCVLGTCISSGGAAGMSGGGAGAGGAGSGRLDAGTGAGIDAPSGGAGNAGGGGGGGAAKGKTTGGSSGCSVGRGAGAGGALVLVGFTFAVGVTGRRLRRKG